MARIIAQIITQIIAWIFSRFYDFFKRESSGNQIQRDGVEIKSYLKLVKSILDQAQETPSESCSKPPKFYLGQCKYLANKLELVVDHAYLFLVPFIDGRCTKASSLKDLARLLDACKQLYACVELVQSFIGDCCNTKWTRVALSMVNVSEHVSSLGFDLEICSIVFSNVGASNESMLSVDEIDELAKHEVEVVRQKTQDDKEALCQSSEASCIDHALGKHLLEALKPSLNQEGYYDEDIKSMPQIGALGNGASGVVHQGIWYKSIDVAKKVLYRDNEHLQREKLIQARLSHFNVMFLFCYGDEDKNLSNTTLLMDLMEGNLFDVIDKRMKRGCIFPFPILVAVDIMLQIGIGMYYVHELGIVYQDLKPQNIFSRHVRKTKFVLTKLAILNM